MPKGLDNRTRDENGEIHRKRGDTRVGTLRDTYGPGFAPGAPSNERLDTLLRQTGEPSLSQYRKSRPGR
jgi:hypothetical protein